MTSPQRTPIQLHPQSQEDPISLREKALEKELTHLRMINTTLDTLVTTIESTTSDINTFNNGTSNAKRMMDKWTEILTQASFTGQMLDDEEWTPQGDEGGREGGLREESAVEEELRILQRRLMTVESENIVLNKKLEKEMQEKRERWNRAEELANKRKRELGLNVAGTGNTRRKLNR
ncbi:hypothetical protein PVL30_004152 [Lodderomyces elongisporus]|uniref:uncharacterized protein n=1 Tax=Lodderomyces elongisporus TaxID=36914 RepID=UPI00291D5006|nr:uncharacterized protein PVL30_004152 [Lodderomyces elongisporus]WLF80375.1 hypothetical protein PVL30_004152 [Lodderomyces elongisporus]